MNLVSVAVLSSDLKISPHTHTRKKDTDISLLIGTLLAIELDTLHNDSVSLSKNSSVFSIFIF